MILVSPAPKWGFFVKSHLSHNSGFLVSQLCHLGLLNSDLIIILYYIYIAVNLLCVKIDHKVYSGRNSDIFIDCDLTQCLYDLWLTTCMKQENDLSDCVFSCPLNYLYIKWKFWVLNVWESSYCNQFGLLLKLPVFLYECIDWIITQYQGC